MVDRNLLTEDEKDIILGNEEKGIEATGKVTIGSRIIDFNISGLTPAPDVTSTPTPTPTSTPEEEATPTPTSTPEEEATPTPTSTPDEEPTPTPTATPNEEPTPTPTPEITTCNLNIDIIFPLEIASQPMDYTDMKIVVQGDNGYSKTMNLGNDSPDFQYLTAEETGDYVTYRMKESIEIEANVFHAIIATGGGYRRFRGTFTPQDDITITLWNGAWTNARPIYEGGTTTYNATFLAGDINGDGIIDGYDQSPVSAYMGYTPAVGNQYHKYDLNRDGSISTADLAIIQILWGE